MVCYSNGHIAMFLQFYLEGAETNQFVCCVIH